VTHPSQGVRVETENEHSGLAVIRAWTEGQRTALRIRITSTDDLTGTAEVVTVVASREEACRMVGAWLDALLAEGALDIERAGGAG